MGRQDRRTVRASSELSTSDGAGWRNVLLPSRAYPARSAAAQRMAGWRRAGSHGRIMHAGGQAGSMSEADRARIERAYDSDGAGSHHHRAHGGEGRRAKAISMASSPRCGDPKRRPREREPVRPRAGSALRGAPDQRWWAGNARGYLPAIAVRATLHPGTGQGAGRSARRGKTGDRTNGRCPRERGARRGSTLTVESGGFNDT